MPSTHDAYLHVITGGFNELKRKRVRKLFQSQSDDEDEEPDTHDPACHDLIVGALEEIHAVGVKSFNLAQVIGILDIFDVSSLISGDVPKYVERTLAIMAVPRSDIESADTTGYAYTIPDQAKLEALRRQHCPEERVTERKEQLADA